MNIEEAIELLKYHSGCHEHYNHPKWKNGFLGQLRPYNGELYEENFLELIQILKVLATKYTNKPIDKYVYAMLFDICTIPRLWAFDPDGMLRRNNLINNKDLTILNNWVIRLSEGVSYYIS